MQTIKTRRGRQVWTVWTSQDGRTADGRWAAERFEDAGTTWSLIFNPLDRGGYHLIQRLTFATADDALAATADGTADTALAAELADVVADDTRLPGEKTRAHNALLALAVAGVA